MTSLNLIPNDVSLENEMLRKLEMAEAEAEEENPKPDHIEALKRIFGHQHFRPMQWKIIDSVMNRKKDVCGTMKTGYGKSLCYQFPSAYNGGITIIVSPLISLMERQVVAMKTLNIPACLLGRANSRTGETLTRIENNRYRLVYLTPEFCTGNFGSELLKKWYRMLSITLIAIDEAHCLSSWGQDFRVSYRKLVILREIMPHVPILAISATANREVMEDIISVLKLRNPLILTSSLDRPNLYFAAFYKSRDIMADLSKVMIRHRYHWKFPGPTIIYCLTRKKVGKMSYGLLGMGLKCLPYHAGLSLAARKEVHEKFVKDEVDVIVATVGFGMGIEKLNVRNVIHYGISKDIDRYYQEINRAGRDGLPAKCVLFYDCADFCFQDESEEDNQVMLSVKNYVDTRNCRRRFILNYFNDPDVSLVERPDCCDNCLRNTKNKNRIYQGAGNNGSYYMISDSTIPSKPSGTLQEPESIHILFLQEKNTSTSVNITPSNKRFLTNEGPPSTTSPTLDMQTNADNLISKSPKTSQMQVDGAKVNLKTLTKDKPEKLYNALLEKRLNLASIEKCTPNKIVSDEALKEMAERRPSTLVEMANCQFYDFSAKKLAKYGKALLDVIKEKTVETVHQEKTIEEILTLCPLVADSALSSFAKQSYSLLISGKSVKEIAEFRGLLVRTVQDHLADCIKFGLPVKLAQVGILKDDVQKIIQAAIDTGLIVRNIKSACSGNITNGQVKLVVAYLQVREHLRMVGTPHKEFEDCDYFQFYKSIEDITVRNLEESDENLSSERTNEHSCRDNRNSAGFSDEGFSDDDLAEICDIIETSICNPFDANQSTLVIDSSDDEPSLKRVKAET